MCKPVLLIGMMGCGKSTIGRLLAGRMGLPLIDLDEEIARAAGRSIPEIFAEEGDVGFRLHETAALRRGVCACASGGAGQHPRVYAGRRMARGDEQLHPLGPLQRRDFGVDGAA